METFCSFSTNFSAAFAGRTSDIWRDIQITVNCFLKKNKIHAYAVVNVMRVHKSCCMKLLKPGALFKDASNAQSFQHRGNVCCLPVPKGHTYSTGFEMCRTNWKKEVGFGVRPHVLFTCEDMAQHRLITGKKMKMLEKGGPRKRLLMV